MAPRKRGNGRAAQSKKGRLLKRVLVEPKRDVEAEVALAGKPRRRAAREMPQRYTPLPTPTVDRNADTSNSMVRFRLTDYKTGHEGVILPKLRDDPKRRVKNPDGTFKLCSAPGCNSFMQHCKIPGLNEQKEEIVSEFDLCIDPMCGKLPTDIKVILVNSTDVVPNNSRFPFLGGSKTESSCMSISAAAGKEEANSTSLINQEQTLRPAPSVFQMPANIQDFNPLNVGSAAEPDMEVVEAALQMFRTRPVFPPLPRWNLKYEMEKMNKFFFRDFEKLKNQEEEEK